MKYVGVFCSLHNMFVVLSKDEFDQKKKRRIDFEINVPYSNFGSKNYAKTNSIFKHLYLKKRKKTGFGTVFIILF